MVRALAAALALAVVLATGGSEARQASGIEKYLPASEADVRALAAGRIVARVDVIDRREVVGAAAARVSTTPERVIAGFRKLSGFTESDLVLAIGRVSSPPAAADFAGLTLDPGEVRSLEECAAGHCGVKLTAAHIDRVRREVPWRSAGAHERAQALFRSLLAEEARRYLRGGHDALDPLVDKGAPVARSTEYATILEHGGELTHLSADLGRRLAQPPGTNGAGIDEFLYWSKIDIGLKPVISLNHVRIYRFADLSADAVIASKQVYANHYFDASLSVTALVTPRPGGPTYLLYVNRSRVDLLGGFFGGITRQIVRKRVRRGLEKNMALARFHLENGG